MTAIIEPGRVLAGRYRLVRAIGQGGMGTIWLAHDDALNRAVAVKEASPPADVSPAERAMLRERTLREARTAARINHPNVVTIYDVVEQDDGRPWIVMELVEARSLRDVVLADGPIAPQQAASIGLQIMAALRAAHVLGIMHRDVKPGNVLIDGDGHAVLTDFGVARADDSPTLTTSGMIVGSPSYIAPERARGERGGPESDLWSLGATLYAVVEGRPPFDRNGAMATLMAVATEDPDPPVRCGELWPVISGLLRRDPSERLDPDATERMLHRVTELDEAKRTAPLAPRSAPPPAAGPGCGPVLADHEAEPPAERFRLAERTRAFRPAALRPGIDLTDLAHDSARRKESAATPGEDSPAQDASGDDTEPTSAAGRPPWRPEPVPPADRAVILPDVRETRTAPPRRLIGVIAVGAALLAVAVVLFAVSSPWASPPVRHSASGHAAGAGPSAAGSAHSQTGRSASPLSSGASRPSAATQSPSPAPTATSASSSQPGVGQNAPVPAGFHRYSDPTGFSIAVPVGWTVSHQGTYVYVTPPIGSTFLLIDQSDHPKPNPLADWQQQEANRIGTYPGYHRIRLEAIDYPQAEKAADWEFTYYRNGVLTHVLNRNVLANADHAYALYWSTPADQWTQNWHFFQVFARTFQPAAP